MPQVEDSTDLENKLAAMPDLKVMQLLSAGVEDVLGKIPDGVQLCDARGVHGGPVSELVLALILATFRQLPHFVRAQERGAWDDAQGEDLIDKRVLVVGAGDLGEQTAKRLRGFDAEPVLVAHSARDGVHATSELPDLLPHADVVVLTVPLTPDTEGMVDAKFLAAMPDGALLVNVARGKVVDTDALLAELTSGRLRAALDVVEPEPLPRATRSGPPRTCSSPRTPPATSRSPAPARTPSSAPRSSATSRARTCRTSSPARTELCPTRHRFFTFT